MRMWRATVRNMGMSKEVKAAVITGMATFLGSVLVVGGALWQGVASVGSPDVSKTTSGGLPAAKIDIDDPLSGAKVPICYVVRGSAEIDPSLERVAVAVLEEDDNRWYFEPQVLWDASHRHWHATVTLGLVGDKQERAYQIAALVLDRSFEDYLSTTNNGLDDNGARLDFWSSPDLPDQWIAAKDQVAVTRSADPGC